MKKSLVDTSKLRGVQQRALTTRNIAQILLEIMRDHIGTENEIARHQLFKKIFKKNEQDTLGDWVRWEFVKKAMHYCRRNTKCFIASRNEDGTWRYFVVADDYDVAEYVNVLKKNIKSMMSMMKRCQKASKQQWHKEQWALPNYSNKELLIEVNNKAKKKSKKKK